MNLGVLPFGLADDERAAALVDSLIYLLFFCYSVLFLSCYLFFGSAIKFAISLYAPGTPAGNSRKNTKPV